MKRRSIVLLSLGAAVLADLEECKHALGACVAASTGAKLWVVSLAGKVGATTNSSSRPLWVSHTACSPHHQLVALGR